MQKLAMHPLDMQLPETIKTQIQGYLWHNEGNDGNLDGVLLWENKELFSNKQ